MPAAQRLRGRDGERDAGAAPVQLLGVDDALEALGVVLQRGQPVEPGHLPLVGLGDHLVRDALLAVVLGSGRPDHLAGEPAAVAPSTPASGHSGESPFCNSVFGRRAPGRAPFRRLTDQSTSRKCTRDGDVKSCRFPAPCGLEAFPAGPRSLRDLTACGSASVHGLVRRSEDPPFRPPGRLLRLRGGRGLRRGRRAEPDRRAGPGGRPGRVPARLSPARDQEHDTGVRRRPGRERRRRRAGGVPRLRAGAAAARGHAGELRRLARGDRGLGADRSARRRPDPHDRRRRRPRRHRRTPSSGCARAAARSPAGRRCSGSATPADRRACGP